MDNIKVGDTVTLSWENGLGMGRFTVLRVNPMRVIHRLWVSGENGQAWAARLEGAKKVA